MQIELNTCNQLTSSKCPSFGVFHHNHIIITVNCMAKNSDDIVVLYLGQLFCFNLKLFHHLKFDGYNFPFPFRFLYVAKGTVAE